MAGESERLVLSDSEREVMNVVRRRGSISRADITDFTDLSQQSVHRLVDNLLQYKLLKTEKAIVKGRGKPSPQITFDTEATTSLGVSVSTNAIEYTAVDLSGTPICSGELKALPNDRDAVMAEMAELVAALQSHGVLSKRRFIGVGVAMQGLRVTHHNQFTTPWPLDNWARIPIDELFQAALGEPAYVENNATSAAIAELFCGGGSGHRCFGYLSFNHGFGGGLMWNEAPVFGGHGNAGEIGSIFKWSELPHRPALEQLLIRLSDRGIVASYPQLLAEFDPSWEGVAEWIAEVKPSLDLAIRALSAVIDPNAIFFGGEAPAALRKMLIEACEPPDTDRLGTPKPYPQLLPSAIDGDAATLGAAMLPLQQTIFRSRS
ncbi:ROK family transcriptional regulator [Hoeflea poritis]|uniref:ROK family transcriptional regulator n=1 Tax=Hoeflea poritis TaxID=2993659 RepID=A0ABT4VQH0_9HYPH|nr:ROK family transcriptional regulator [Hoeflea poritis]MDA4846962.1 ROK family transcriptional regulator [Hoeflea poritis]